MTIDIQTRFSDFDMMYHVNNIAQQYYFDLGNVEYLKTVLGMNCAIDDLCVVKAHMSVNFYKPIEVNDSICVVTRVKETGTKSITLWQEILDKKNGEVKSDCKTVMVAFSNKTKTSIPVPEEWKEAIRKFEQL